MNGPQDGRKGEYHGTFLQRMPEEQKGMGEFGKAKKGFG